MINFTVSDCRSLFLRDVQSGKCITRSEELAYDNPSHALPYYVVMDDKCLDDKAQFRYLDTELLHQIEKGGTLVSSARDDLFYDRWVVFKGISSKYHERADLHRLKQTDARSLFFYDMGVCAEPSATYIMRKKYCNTTKQEFTFGMCIFSALFGKFLYDIDTVVTI